MKKFWTLLGILLMFCAFGVTSFAAEEKVTLSDTMFQIGTYTYEIIDAEQSDMPEGFTLGTYGYHGQTVDAGHTENSSMLCMMAADVETGYEYRFIYDVEADLFCPYFGADIKNGYVYTIPVEEDDEVPFGFQRVDYVIQTVPVTVYQREDSDLTLEEIALGIVSEDAYLVFLMMNEEGEEVYYTYDLTDRTFQRAMLQVRDAEKIKEYDDMVTAVHEEYSVMQKNFTKQMSDRLILMGIMIGITVICIGIIINQSLKIRYLKAELRGDFAEETEEEEDLEETETEEVSSERAPEEKQKKSFSETVSKSATIDDDIEIIDLDEE